MAGGGCGPGGTMRLPALACCACLTALTGAAQTDAEPPGLLSRITQTVAQNLSRVPNYTCVENIERASRPQPARKFLVMDHVRLEVAESGGKELFAPAVARQFEEKHPADFVDQGAAGNGDFALFLRNIFLNTPVVFRYGGSQETEGRPSILYSYEVRGVNSGYLLVHRHTAARVPFHGAFWVNAESLELIRLDVIADRNPPQIEMASISTQIDYAHFQIGGKSFLLPQTSTLMVSYLSGVEHRNRMEFTHCRQFAGTSSISFDDPKTGPLPETNEREIAPGLRLYLDLTSPIDLPSAKAGDLLTATVTAKVERKGRTVVPVGTQITGRLRSIQRTGRLGYVVTLEFSEIQSGAGRTRFFAELEHAHLRQGRVETLSAGGLPGVVMLALEGIGALPAADLRMVWKTVKLSEGK